MKRARHEPRRTSGDAKTGTLFSSCGTSLFFRTLVRSYSGVPLVSLLRISGITIRTANRNVSTNEVSQGTTAPFKDQKPFCAETRSEGCGSSLTFNTDAVESSLVLLLSGALDVDAHEGSSLPVRIAVPGFAHAPVSASPEPKPVVQRFALQKGITFSCFKFQEHESHQSAHLGQIPCAKVRQVIKPETRNTAGLLFLTMVVDLHLAVPAK